VEFHLVHAAPETVMAVQLRRVDVGEPRVRLHLLAAQQASEASEVIGRQRGRVQLERGLQRAIADEQVVVHQRFGLVQDFMRCFHARPLWVRPV
jgi:hypothetical protein